MLLNTKIIPIAAILSILLHGQTPDNFPKPEFEESKNKCKAVGENSNIAFGIAYFVKFNNGKLKCIYKTKIRKPGDVKRKQQWFFEADGFEEFIASNDNFEKNILDIVKSTIYPQKIDGNRIIYICGLDFGYTLYVFNNSI